MACSIGLKAIAITDHDTVDGVIRAIDAGLPGSLEFITGIEISTAPPPGFPCSGSFHLLGYGFAPDHPELTRILNIVQKARKERNPRILQRLEAIGIHLAADHLADGFADNGQIGRPHIARLMIEKGVVSSIDEAFDRYLGKGKPAYVEKFRVESSAAIEAIRAAGGIAVLAHPALLKLPAEKTLEELVQVLVEMGLEGIEVLYTDHTPAHVFRFRKIAEDFRLTMTGGSDFHGGINPDVQLGIGKGNLQVPYELFTKLNQKIAGSNGGPRLREKAQLPLQE